MHFFSSGLLVFASLLVACGGSADAQEASPESPVDGRKQLSMLTDTEASTVCRHLDGYWKAKVPSEKLATASCTLQAYLAGLASGGIATCNASFDACMRGEPAAAPTTDCAAFATRAKTCKRTVAELLACNVEQATGVYRLASMGKAYCGHLGAKEPPPATGAANVCQQIDLDCPELHRHE